MTVLLLAFSLNLLASDKDSAQSSLTGVLVSDNYALVSCDALRLANAKMAELEYEKEINKNLKEIVFNDSIIISSLKTNIEIVEEEHKQEVKSVKKKLYIAEGCSGVLVILLVLAII